MTPVAGSPPRLDGRRRAAAAAALLVGTTAVVVAVASLAGQVGAALLAGVLLLATVALAWSAVTRHGRVRLLAGSLAVAALAGVVALLLGGDRHTVMVVVVAALVVLSAGLSRYALRRDRASLVRAEAPGTPVGPAGHGTLIMNLRSGGGKAERFHLEEECRRRGIEPVVLRPGDDLLALARAAVDRGADVLGMAGGDGSQALVASVAMAVDVPLVCIPAGTRNHFALDLGLDRDDVVGALDTFGEAVERRIDLATVGERVFVNNVSLGVYAKVVQSPEYRDAKRQTTQKLLPELLGPEAPPFDLRYPGPDGTERSGAQIIMVSNNPYRLTGLSGVGSRARLDLGALGIMTTEVKGAAGVAALMAAESAGRVDRFPGFAQWNAPTFVVDADQPVEAGVDGEALRLDPPLEFRSLPGALRVRIPTHAPGWSPAALTAPSAWWSVRALFRAVAGRPTPIDETRR